MIRNKILLPKGIGGFALYTLALLASVMLLPPVALQPGAEEFIFVVGSLAIWRYSWGLLHFVRSVIYRKWTFPRLRALVEADGKGDLMPSKMYLLVTSFRIELDTTIRVFRATIAEAIGCGVPTTIVASIVELGDEFLIKDMFRRMNPPDRVKLMIVRIPGTGKRDGLALAFRAISRDMPPPDAVVAVIDGDSECEEGLIRKTAPFFKLLPDIGALTTDEDCDVKGSRIMREWHDLRFAQRQIQMASMGLSHKVLTLTGRMSMFRADIVCNADFIAHVEDDSVNHWRLGRFKFLTGDDKSSWFWVIKNGWNMLYVPDVVVMTVEHPPSDNFFRASTQLMFRWFGNMLRTNGRAIRLGPGRIGLFTWWCVIDQRISMWTALSGPVFAVMLCIKHTIFFLPIYLTWIAFTRWVMSLLLLSARPVLSWYYPFLIYYNQIWGSCIKTYVFFRLDRQSWTRQKTKLNRGLTAFQEKWIGLTSATLHVTAILCFVTTIGLISGIVTFPVDMVLRLIG